MSTKRTVERYEYIHERIARVTFESCGITDRDCELKFHMGSHAFSIDIVKAEQPQAQHFYRVLQELSRAQAGNARKWDFAKSALDSSVRAMRISDPGTTATTLLVDQAVSVQAWLQDTFATTNPRCY